MSLPLKLVCFDVNKTLIHENTWLNLNTAMGITPLEDARWLSEYKQGKLTYLDWQKILEQRYLASGHATKAHIMSVINRYTYQLGARETVSYLQQRGYILYLLSGSMDLLVEHIAQELGIIHYDANNRFVFDSNDKLVQIECLGNDVSVKATQLKSLCEKLRIDVTQAVCVGDGDNDIELFRLSQHGVTFKGSPIEQKAWKIIDQLADLQTFL